jgi:quercetin dioxygenase-like cupin family protein
MRLTTIAALLLTISAAAAGAQSPAGSPVASPADVKWGPAPAVFPPGAQMAVLQGDPGSAAPFTVRLRFPDGYTIAPHTHPTDEYLTVISGTFRVGMGTTVDAKGMLTLGTGGFATAPANHAHYAAARGVTVVQINSMGPFAMTYVNPADTPRADGSR